MAVLKSFLCLQDTSGWSSASSPNSTRGAIDSDGGETPLGHLSLPGKARKSFSQLKHGKAYSSLYQWTKPNGFLVDRKKMEKFRKKRRLVRKDAALPDVKYPEENEEEERLREREGEEPYGETPLSPSSEGDAQSSTGRCSAWDSDTPSNPPYAAAAPEEQSLVQTVGKRTIIRQGKQVVFRDEDGSGDDEDIMVDSGNPCGNLSNVEPRMKMVRSERKGSVGYRPLEDGVSPQRCFSILVTFGQSLSLNLNTPHRAVVERKIGRGRTIG